MSCQACLPENEGKGLPHTCAGSGTALAAAIHEVESIVIDPIPRYGCELRLEIEAWDEHEVGEMVKPIIAAVLDDDRVTESELVITRRPGI